MNDAIKGMTTAEAREFVGRVSIPFDSDDLNKLMALAALGAEVVNAKEMWTSDNMGFLSHYRCEGDRRVLVLESE